MNRDERAKEIMSQRDSLAQAFIYEGMPGTYVAQRANICQGSIFCQPAPYPQPSESEKSDRTMGKNEDTRL